MKQNRILVIHPSLNTGGAEKIIAYLVNTLAKDYSVQLMLLKDIEVTLPIDREVKVFDKDSFDNIYNPLYTMGSSKLCRKTHLDMLTKVQVNMYVSGHHKEGSSAVKHNSSLILKDRFIFMCAAYKQLNVIEK